MLALNRKLHRAYNRVREGNFALDGLLRFDLHGKTVGVFGTGKIGTVMAKILTGFGCPTLAFDPIPNEKCRSLGARYVELDELLVQSDIVTLHCPLTPETAAQELADLCQVTTGCRATSWAHLGHEKHHYR